MAAPAGQIEKTGRARPLVLHTRVVTGSGGGPDKTILNSPRFLADEYEMVCAYMRPNGDPGVAEITHRGEAKGACWPQLTGGSGEANPRLSHHRSDYTVGGWP